MADEFDPDAFLAQTQPAKTAPPPQQPAAFDPDAFLASTAPKPIPEFAPQVVTPPEPTAPPGTAAARQAAAGYVPEIVTNLVGGAADVARGFVTGLPKTLTETAFPEIAAARDIQRGARAIGAVAGGEPISTVIPREFPESQVIPEAEKTPAFSRERFATGFGVLGNILGAAAGVRGLRAPEIPIRPTEPLPIPEPQVEPLPVQPTERRFTMVPEAPPALAAAPELAPTLEALGGREFGKVTAEGVVPQPPPTEPVPSITARVQPEVPVAREPVREELQPRGGEISATQERQIQEGIPVERPGDVQGRPPAEAGVGGGVQPAAEVGRPPAAPEAAVAAPEAPPAEVPPAPVAEVPPTESKIGAPPVQSTEPPPETASTNPHASGIANRLVQERAARGEIGPIAPGEGYSVRELAARGQGIVERDPAAVDNAVSRTMQGGEQPVSDAAVLRFEESRLSQRSANASKTAEANPGNIEARKAADDAFKDLTDFHNGPIAQLKQNWANQGRNFQEEIPVDLSTYNGVREAWLRETGTVPPPTAEPAIRTAANGVKKAVDADAALRARWGEAAAKGPPARMTAESVRQQILDELGKRNGRAGMPC